MAAVETSRPWTPGVTGSSPAASESLTTEAPAGLRFEPLDAGTRSPAG